MAQGITLDLSTQALAKMNAIDSNSVLAHQLSAEVMESMNNYDGAVVQLKKASRRWRRASLGNIQIGRCLLEPFAMGTGYRRV